MLTDFKLMSPGVIFIRNSIVVSRLAQQRSCQAFSNRLDPCGPLIFHQASRASSEIGSISAVTIGEGCADPYTRGFGVVFNVSSQAHSNIVDHCQKLRAYLSINVASIYAPPSRVSIPI